MATDKQVEIICRNPECGKKFLASVRCNKQLRYCPDCRNIRRRRSSLEYRKRNASIPKKVKQPNNEKVLAKCPKCERMHTVYRKDWAGVVPRVLCPRCEYLRDHYEISEHRVVW